MQIQVPNGLVTISWPSAFSVQGEVVGASVPQRVQKFSGGRVGSGTMRRGYYSRRLVVGG